MTSPAKTPRIPDTEFLARRVRAAEAARARGLDALLVWGRGGSLDAFSDVHYFTNHFDPYPWVPPLPSVWTGYAQAGVVILGDGTAVLLVTRFHSDAIQATEVRENRDLAVELVATLRDLELQEARVGLIGTEVLPYSFGAALGTACPKLELEPADDISQALRQQLSESEVDVLRHAGEVGSSIYNAFLAAAQPGATEGEAIGAGVAKAASSPGCTHWSFLSSSGPRADRFVSTTLPPWDASYVYKPGDVLHPDCYGYVDGYCYDLGRTFVVGGSPTERQAYVMQGAVAVCQAMEAALVPGVTCSDLENCAKATLKTLKLSHLAGFGHALGAGFFRPYIVSEGPDATRPLEPPMAIAFEVFLTDGDGSYAFNEDNYLLLSTGTECLTRDAGAWLS
jgi:Xaa-Pro aminopeptidase